MPRVTFLEFSALPKYFYLPKYRQVEQFSFGNLWVISVCG